MENQEKPRLIGTRNIKDTVPQEDRPREKAKKHGFGSLSTAELLAILLRVGTPGESVVDLCQRAEQITDALKAAGFVLADQSNVAQL